MRDSTRATWVARIEEWKRSGKTAEEFAAGQPFSGGTLTWRASQLRHRPGDVRGESAARGPSRRRRVSADSKIVLAEVVRRAPELRDESLVVEVANARIAVRAGFDKALLCDVVAALREVRS